MVPTAAAITLTNHAVGNAILLYHSFSPLLEHDAIDMTHLDPSVIIDTAIPLKNLGHFVALSCILSIAIIWGCQRATLKLSLVNNMILTGIATVFAQCSFILCGINPMKLPIHTFISALYVTTITVLPITLSAPSGEVIASSQHGKSRLNYDAVVAYLFGPISNNSNPSTKNKQQLYQRKVQRMHQYSTLGTLIGMCACAIFRVLDHGMQIQRYPMPIIIGATVGRVGGVLMTVLVTVTVE
mmetsp:Transcript_22655/g.45569  ORF Transcript_22655/g.45569 Transcript_22655/m.45569 type:complete len:241 (-) Transcript_22655:57-779(-)